MAGDTQIALISKDIQYIQQDISEIKTSMKELTGMYVTQTQFQEFIKNDYGSVKKVMYGAVALVLTAFGLAIVNFFIK